MQRRSTVLSSVKRWSSGVTVRSDVPKVVEGVAVGSKLGKLGCSYRL